MMTKNNEDLYLGTKNNFILSLYVFLKKIGIKNPWNIYQGIKSFCFRWFIDGFFCENYYFISNERYLKAKEFKQYFDNKGFFKLSYKLEFNESDGNGNLTNYGYFLRNNEI